MMRIALALALACVSLAASAPTVAAGCVSPFSMISVCDENGDDVPDRVLIAQGASTMYGGGYAAWSIGASRSPHDAVANSGGAADANVLGTGAAARAHGGCAVGTGASASCAAMDPLQRGWVAGARGGSSPAAGVATSGDTRLDVVAAHVWFGCERVNADGCGRVAGGAWATAYATPVFGAISYGPGPHPALCLVASYVAVPCVAAPP